jgi:membrane protein DedA with SNARE-associated domain
MTNIGTLAQTYGYPVVVLGTMLQGETVLLVIGFLAHRGYLSPWIVAIVGAMSAIFGDTTCFFIGRYYGERFLSWLPVRMRSPLYWARRFVDRHSTKVLLFMRFFFGMGFIMPVACGMSSIKTGRFFKYNMPMAFVWAGFFVALGYLFGTAAEKVLREVKNVEPFLILALVIIGYLYHRIARRKQTQQNGDNETL